MMLKPGLTLMGLSLAARLVAAEAAPLYQNDFEKGEIGNVPDDMLVLDGAFGVKAVDGNKVLELPGSPLETYGVLFGPAESSGISVQARIHATGKGRRFPTFCVGLNGVGGYRLRVSPAKKLLELYKGDDMVSSTAHSWDSGTWTVVRLESVKSANGGMVVRGKAWKQGDKEPTAWAIEHTAEAEPPAGRPSIWGSPYAGTPIQFDDIRVSAVTK